MHGQISLWHFLELLESMLQAVGVRTFCSKLVCAVISGVITGVISGKNYNRCWLVHEAFAEAVERLFLDIFLPDMPD